MLFLPGLNLSHHTYSKIDTHFRLVIVQGVEVVNASRGFCQVGVGHLAKLENTGELYNNSIPPSMCSQLDFIDAGRNTSERQVKLSDILFIESQTRVVHLKDQPGPGKALH